MDEITNSIFGIQALFPFQRHVISNTLEQQNQLVLFPTGAGKSICFQLPALLLPGLTVVASPLLALMADQIRSLEETGVPALVLKGGQTDSLRDEIFASAAEKKAKILYATPEILENEKLRECLKEIGISHFVLDEAHLVSEWGGDFRPAFRRLGEIAQDLGAASLSAFTATASEEITAVISEYFFRDNLFLTVRDIPDRPNIFYSVIPVLSRKHNLVETVKNAEKPLVVFTRSRKSAEHAARLLRTRLADDRIFFYHAGLDKQERKKIENWFFNSNDGILTSTCAYGMGVDKKDIRTIIHYDVPLSVEAYLQESGRAGRDGKEARAILFIGHEDLHFTKKLADDTGKRRFQKLMDAVHGTPACRRKTFASLMGQQVPFCSGCDVCMGANILLRAGEKEIMHLIGRNPRRFTNNEIVDIMAGKKSYKNRDSNLESRPFFGSLAGWEKDDIREAIEILETYSFLEAPSKGLFKYRYRMGNADAENASR